MPDILDKMLLFNLAICSGMSFSDLCSTAFIDYSVSGEKKHMYSERTFPCRRYL